MNQRPKRPIPILTAQERALFETIGRCEAFQDEAQIYQRYGIPVQDKNRELK